MTNYYIEEAGEILLHDTDRQRLINTINGFMTQYKDLEILETERPIVNKQFADTDEYLAEQEKAERERINMLSLTKREVFLALYKDKGITPDKLKEKITDPEALIEFDYAETYFRGNPLIDKIGMLLGYTTEELDYLFENKGFRQKEEENEENS